MISSDHVIRATGGFRLKYWYLKEKDWCWSIDRQIDIPQLNVNDFHLISILRDVWKEEKPE